MYMQGDYENLLKDKYGETFTTEDDNTPSNEFVAPRISTTEDAELFYRVTSGFKKGRVYGLGSQGVIMAIAHGNSFSHHKLHNSNQLWMTLLLLLPLKRQWVRCLMNMIVW